MSASQSAGKATGEKMRAPIMSAAIVARIRAVSIIGVVMWNAALPAEGSLLAAIARMCLWRNPMRNERTLRLRTEPPRDVIIQPGGDVALFYSGSASEARCIGHLRLDVDGCGKLWSSWWPHQAAQKYNRQPFKNEFDALVNALQRRLFATSDQIMQMLIDMQIPCMDAASSYYSFHIDTDDYSYYMRLFPHVGDYSYIYCYTRKEDERENTDC